MRLRALTRGLAVTTVAAGLIATGVSTASAATVTGSGDTPSMAKTLGPAAASAAASSASNTTVKVDVVMPLPRDTVYRDHGYYHGDDKLPLPEGYRMRDGNIYGPDGIALAPISAHDDVVSVPVACRGGLFAFSPVTNGNWISNIINGAFNAARAGVEAAAGIAQAAVGGSNTPGAKC
jgi:hypothetical protein